MADGYSFKRYEYKYLLDEEQYKKVREMLKGKMTVDKYGLSTIANIYFDTDDYRLVRTSLEKPDYKEKLRLRSYGVPDGGSTVFLEIKKKFDGIVYKRRISLTLTEAEDYLIRGIKPEISAAQRQIFNEIDHFVNHYKPVSKVYLAYDRVALYGNEDNALRVTFDTDIRSRTDSLSLASGDSGELLFEEKKYLMEIKAAGAIPLWFVKILGEAGVTKTSFSKYGSVYSKTLWRTVPAFTGGIKIASAPRRELGRPVHAAAV